MIGAALGALVGAQLNLACSIEDQRRLQFDSPLVKIDCIPDCPCLINIDVKEKNCSVECSTSTKIVGNTSYKPNVSRIGGSVGVPYSSYVEKCVWLATENNGAKNIVFGPRFVQSTLPFNIIIGQPWSFCVNELPIDVVDGKEMTAKSQFGRRENVQGRQFPDVFNDQLDGQHAVKSGRGSKILRVFNEFGNIKFGVKAAILEHKGAADNNFWVHPRSLFFAHFSKGAAQYQPLGDTYADGDEREKSDGYGSPSRPVSSAILGVFMLAFGALGIGIGLRQICGYLQPCWKFGLFLFFGGGAMVSQGTVLLLNFFQH
jgi:hypothetical protein